MPKTLNLNQSVYELVTQYPELSEILAALGFTEITKPVMLKSVGKMMTLKKGSAIKGIDMKTILEALKAAGFEISEEGEDPQKEKRQYELRSYLERLNKGEELETVREDFVQNFSHVDASEIMEAEQALMMNGMPLKEVSRLCDVHSALFHDHTEQEELQKGMEQLRQSASQQQLETLSLTNGHPLQVFRQENQILNGLIEEAQSLLKEGKVPENLSGIKDVIIHYKKKGDLLYPVLKTKYNVTGPHQVMWTVDDEIRDEFNRLSKKESLDDLDQELLSALLQRMQEMIYKEENILYPISADKLSEEDWKQIYQDAKDYDLLFGLKEPVWKEAETPVQKPASLTLDSMQDEIVMPGGHLSLEQLQCMLNTLPIEITFVDVNDTNCYFNEGPKVFKRPLAAIGRSVYDCHPPKVEKVVRTIIDDLRNHRRENVAVWMTKEGKPFLVDYRGVYDAKGDYIGTVECVQDMSVAKDYFDKLHLSEQIRQQRKLEKEMESNPSVTEVNVHEFK